jgi:hypothetical protein
MSVEELLKESDRLTTTGPGKLSDSASKPQT